MIGSVVFRNFKALRATSVSLEPFNLLIGPNGSGKSSLFHAILRLRTLARLPLKVPTAATVNAPDTPHITFRFTAPHEQVEAVLSCVNDTQCDLLEIRPGAGGAVPPDWPLVRERLLTIRAYLFDHDAMALPAPRHDDRALNSNGGNLAAVLTRWQTDVPAAFQAVRDEVVRLLPEYRDLRLTSRDGGTVEVALELVGGGELVLAEALSQGTLYVLGLCVLAHDPEPPALVCIEEVDRGIHPRLLRAVRDLLYRLSHPESQQVDRRPAQVIATTHSPYLLDLFRDHPEEVIIAEKQGREAHFVGLAAREDLAQILAEGSLGDLWFSGLLGGVPEER